MRTWRTLLPAVAAVVLSLLAVPPAPAAPSAPSAPSGHAAPVGYDLPDPGVLLEGIGAAHHPAGWHRVFYVSGVNDGGDVYRGEVGRELLQRWYDGTGTTGRGVDVDRRGRVYVAGGPTGTVRIFSRHGTLLATLANGTPGSFLNDLWVGPDGSVYVTDSSLPTIWRVTRSRSGWALTAWLDVSPTITYTPDPADFDLGGIVTTRDGDYLLTSQGTTGQLWRIDLATREIVEVDLRGASIPNADGIVLQGRTLWVVQNFLRQVSRFRLDHDWDGARLRRVQATPADKTLTTAKLLRGRLLAVDSQFGFPPATAPAEDRVLSLNPWAGERPS
jgi:Cu-Zn family superoxide dismutase